MKLLTLSILCALAISTAYAAPITQLSFDAGGGVTADLLVDQVGTVSCTGSCGGLTFASTVTPHGTLNVTGTIGQFMLTTVSGVGQAGVTPPAVLNLTQ